ncbi:MAG: hypothetical protein ABEJ91_02700 [Candidatus Nanohaloarchaea archaeon]
MEGVVEELEGRDYRVRNFSREDIDREEQELAGTSYEVLDGTSMVVRSKRGFFPEDRWERGEALRELTELEQHLEPVTGARESFLMNDKETDLAQLQEHGVGTVERYLDEEGVRRAQERGEWVVEKTPEGMGGDGVHIYGPGTEFEYDPDRIYEECIDHWTAESPWEERRAYGIRVSGEEGFTSKVTGVVERQLESGKKEPKNMSGDGRATVPGEVRETEIETMHDVLEATGDSILGVDYLVNQETGEVKVIERNSNAGWKYSNEALDYDLNREFADVLEQKIEGEDYEGFSVSSGLEKLIKEDEGQLEGLETENSSLTYAA